MFRFTNGSYDYRGFDTRKSEFNVNVSCTELKLGTAVINHAIAQIVIFEELPFEPTRVQRTRDMG
jgi:hypothetical protein